MTWPQVVMAILFGWGSIAGLVRGGREKKASDTVLAIVVTLTIFGGESLVLHAGGFW